MVASEVFEIPYNKVDNLTRFNAKAISFGLIYGLTIPGLANRLNTSESRAQDYMEKYFRRMPEVNTAIKNSIEHVRQFGYVVNPFGRRRRFDYVDPKVEREAFNAIIQSFSSDLLQLALIKFDNECEKLGDERVYPLIDVHDNLLPEVENKKRTIDKAIELLNYCMVEAPLENKLVRNALWGVKPSITIEIGYKWGEMYPYDVFMEKIFNESY